MIDTYYLSRGCVVLVLNSPMGMEVRVPYEQWNVLIERIGPRHPEADKDCPP